MRARRIGVLPHRQRFRHRAADQGIDHRFGAGDPRRDVVAQHQRVAHEFQVAVDDGDLQWFRRCGNPGVDGGRFAAEQRVVVDIEGRARCTTLARRAAAHLRVRLCCAVNGTAHTVDRCLHRQQAGAPLDQQLQIGIEGAVLVGQAAVLAVDLPGRHAGQHGAGQRHPAITGIGRVQVDQPVVADLVAIGRELRAADHQHDLVCQLRPQRVVLRIEAPPERHGRVEHRLFRHTPAIGVGLPRVVVPP